MKKQKTHWLSEKTIQEAHEKGSPDSLLGDMEKIIPYATEGVEEGRELGQQSSTVLLAPGSLYHQALSWLNPTRECGTT